MTPDSPIFVAGHRGLAGSAIVRALRARGYRNLLLRSHGELDLVDQQATGAFFASQKPAFVFHAAGKVGGIMANSTQPAAFIYENLAMELNVIHAAYQHGVSKLLFLGSSCIYPRHTPQPMREEHLLTSPLEPSNEPYAIAKIAGIKLCAAYNRQYGTDFLCAQPTNLYGPGDNYHPVHSHVMAAMIRRMHEARESGIASVVVWGSGTPRREFLHADDMAEACVKLMERHSAAEIGELINVGSGTDISIGELAHLVADVVGYRGGIEFDRSKPDGTPLKLMDVSRLQALGWQARTGLREGIARAYEDFLAESAGHPASALHAKVAA